MSTVSRVIDDHLAAIEHLCRLYHVASMELFGSATNSKFDAACSDLDFLVEFEPLPPAQRADAYFGLLAALQDLFRRDVDLVEASAIENPYFRKAIEMRRMVLYAI